jgi:hypothetical protein
MATSISNLTNSTALDGLLKKVYLPTMQSVAYDDTRFSEMIQARSDIIPGGGNHIVHFAQTQRAEGVGAISEGGNWVNNVPVKGKQMTENVKYLNSYIALTGPVIKAANSNEKSAIDVVTAHFKTNIRAFKNNFDRMLMGDGSGRMALVSSVASIPAVTVTKTGFACAPFNADQFIPVGTRCNVATFGTGVTEAIAASGMKNANVSDDYGFIIAGHTSRSTSAGTAVVDVHDEDDVAYAGAGTVDIAAADYFVREGAYGTAGTGAKNWTDCLEINGLSNLVSDGSSNSETSGNFLTCWGQTRTSFNFLQSLMTDFASAELDEDNLLDMMMDLQYSRQATPNLLMTTPKAEKKYFLNKKDDRRFTNVGPMNFVGGYTRMGIQLGEWQLILTSLGAVPSGKLFVINTSDFAFAQNSPIEWVLGDGGNVLVQSHTGDNKFASAVQYVNFVCFDPYRQAKGYSVAE